jgi:hypothetical protein
MDATNYILEELGQFVKHFSMSRVRYEYKKRSDIHFVEISPKDFYNHNDDFLRWEDQMYDNFVERFPDENICFVTEDDVVGIDRDKTEKDGIHIFNGENYISIENLYSLDFPNFSIDNNSNIECDEISEEKDPLKVMASVTIEEMSHHVLDYNQSPNIVPGANDLCDETSVPVQNGKYQELSLAA